jgi:hypothetical protein
MRRERKIGDDGEQLMYKFLLFVSLQEETK